MKITLIPIGKIENKNGDCCVVVEKQFRPALKGLKDFSYAQIFWWFSDCDDALCRSNLKEVKPYNDGPEELGVFATRSPQRPNPLALTTSYITYIDENSGRIGLAYIDAFDGTPVLDIKPYTPSLDKVENPQVPEWCAQWPKNIEESGDFDWESVFNF